MMYALVDCNNFYASCERIFNPAIQGKPVVVLSNNDGCVIARSAEAKALGVKMGAVYWQVKDFLIENKIHVYSSNYQLYGDISERIMNILAGFCDEIEVYSIDESFLHFNFFQQDEKSLLQYCLEIKKTIFQQTGVPVSIGLGKTKTLAKLANHIAKKQNNTGCFILEKDDDILKKISIENIWGIGRAFCQRLKLHGIEYVFDLQNVSQVWIKNQFGVTLLRTVKELNAFSCLSLDAPIEQRKNMVVSRSFRKDVYDLPSLEEAVAVYATRLGEKLRQYQQTTAYLSLFLTANPFRNTREDGKRYFTSSMELSIPTSNTNALISNALKLLHQIYEPKTNYKKAGILANGLATNQVIQGSLFESLDFSKKSKDLMLVMDNLNKKYGKASLYFAACGQQHDWARQEQFRSPHYTTNWNELLRVYI